MPPKPSKRGAGGNRSGTGSGPRPRPLGMKKKVTTDVSEQAGCSAVGKKATTLSSPPTKQFEKNHAKRAGDKKTPIQKAPVGTKEDGMARKIQTCFRGYRCRKLLQELRKKRTEYDEMMEKLQREAYVQMVKLERQRAEAERMWKSEERQKQKEQAQRISRMLEAAFEGDTIVIKSILEEVRQLWREHSDGVITRHQYLLVQCTDANENSPISEAAAGGDIDTIRLLLSLEANPNTKGQYGRTPLYRAAFAGHHGAVKVLLEGGADPRLTADDGARPEQVASNPRVEEVFQEWRIQDTEELLKNLAAAQKNRIKAQEKLLETIGNKLQQEIDDAEKEYSAKQKELSKAHEELNKRIFEHDKNIATGAVKADITLAVVHDAEDHLESQRLAAEAARNRLSQAKLQLRLQRKEFGNDDENVEGSEEFSDVTINIRELDDVLMKDVGNKIAESGKWPLLIDHGKLATTFLRYRDTNYIDCCNPQQMGPEVIRVALLGAIKYGKFFVMDLVDVDGLWEGVEQQMNLVQKDLLKDLMDMSLIKHNKFHYLTRDSDGEEYSAKVLLSAKVHNFKLVVITQLFSLPKDFMERFYVIRIHTCDPQ